MAFIPGGLVFMLFPGTLPGVWNLLQISGRGHGHAQVFGWVGSFLLGIAF